MNGVADVLFIVVVAVPTTAICIVIIGENTSFWAVSKIHLGSVGTEACGICYAQIRNIKSLDLSMSQRCHSLRRIATERKRFTSDNVVYRHRYSFVFGDETATDEAAARPVTSSIVETRSVLIGLRTVRVLREFHGNFRRFCSHTAQLESVFPRNEKVACTGRRRRPTRVAHVLANRLRKKGNRTNFFGIWTVRDHIPAFAKRQFVDRFSIYIYPQDCINCVVIDDALPHGSTIWRICIGAALQEHARGLWVRCRDEGR
mmetsp:Transcript_26548/g.61120  ORF Transcript_26548/g.61120 Transcript_26548/m.61120 type:complete len:259 (-) Transcript_26548:169-945(-)